MTGGARAGIYTIRRTFDVPLDFAYRWCTDYRAFDGRLSKEGNRRLILRKTRRQVVYEDLTQGPDGWFWSRQTVTLHPPDRWTATAEGNYRTWELDYRLRARADGRTEFTMRGLRRPFLLGAKNPSQRTLTAELQRMWRNFGEAMESDYRRSARRRRA